MTPLVVRLVVTALALAAAVWVVPGVQVTAADTTGNVLTLLGVAVIFGVVNAVIRPVVALVSLPLYLLTLGLIAFVINALMLWLTSALAGALGVPFAVEGFWAALLGGLVVSFVSWVLMVALED